MFDSLRPHGLQHTRRPCAFLSPGVCSNSWLFIELMMLSNHFVFCRPLFLLPLIFPSIRVFSNVSALRIRWPKYWSFSLNPSNEYSGLISFRIEFDLLAVQGTLKNHLQHHGSKGSILWCWVFNTPQIFLRYEILQDREALSPSTLIESLGFWLRFPVISFP